MEQTSKTSVWYDGYDAGLESETPTAMEVDFGSVSLSQLNIPHRVVEEKKMERILCILALSSWRKGEM